MQVDTIQHLHCVTLNFKLDKLVNVDNNNIYIFHFGQ